MTSCAVTLCGVLSHALCGERGLSNASVRTTCTNAESEERVLRVCVCARADALQAEVYALSGRAVCASGE